MNEIAHEERKGKWIIISSRQKIDILDQAFTQTTLINIGVECVFFITSAINVFYPSHVVIFFLDLYGKQFYNRTDRATVAATIPTKRGVKFQFPTRERAYSVLRIRR
jgi:hypothetical protein